MSAINSTTIHSRLFAVAMAAYRHAESINEFGLADSELGSALDSALLALAGTDDWTHVRSNIERLMHAEPGLVWVDTAMAKLAEERDRLRTALAHYTDATVVADWGYQELADDGQSARFALGLPDPDPHTLALRLSVACICPVCSSEAAQ